MLVLGFPDYLPPAERLAAALGAECATIDVHHFPDGESRVRLPSHLPEHIVLCRSLDHPNDKLVELLLIAGTAREAGVERITLVAPYLCYMRQDAAFHPGEAVSQRIVGRWLGGLFDRIITVDPHLHRVHNLADALPGAEAVRLSAAPLISKFLREGITDPFLLGPDQESEQWVSGVAADCGCEHAVATKRRRDDRSVEITFADGLELHGRTVVLIDDMTTTGNTLATCAQAALAAGAAQVHCLITHALFVGGAELVLARAGIGNIWSTDSVPHPSNTIALAGLLAQAMKD